MVPSPQIGREFYNPLVAKLHDPAGIEFLRTELQTGLVFANTALSANPDETDKIARATENARKAYNSFLKFRERVTLSSSDQRSLAVQAEQLKVALRSLGISI